MRSSFDSHIKTIHPYIYCIGFKMCICIIYCIFTLWNSIIYTKYSSFSSLRTTKHRHSVQITPWRKICFFYSSRGLEPRVLWDKGWLWAASVAFCKGNFVRDACRWTFQVTLCLSEMFQNGYLFNAFISRVQYQMFIETIGYSASPCRSCVVFTGFYWYFCLGGGGAGDGETNENNFPSQNLTWHLPIGNMIFLGDFWCQFNFLGGYKIDWNI